MVGCDGRQGGGPDKSFPITSGVPWYALVKELESPDATRRAQAAKAIKDIMPADKMRALPAVKRALAKETDEQAKAAMKEALASAKGGGRGRR